MAKTARKVTVAPVVTAPVPAVKVAAPKPRVISTGKKDTFKVSIPVAPVQVPAPTTKRPKTERIVHEVASLYTGPSPGINKRKSRTVLDLSAFNTNPGYILKDRSELVAETIKREYGNKPFTRGNFDAGVLKFLLWKGHVEAVSGNGDENTVLRFTKDGLAHRRQSA